MKSDQEESIKVLIDLIAKERAACGGSEICSEYSPKGSSCSNGVIKRGVSSVEAQVRVLRSALEERWGVHLQPRCYKSQALVRLFMLPCQCCEDDSLVTRLHLWGSRR